MELHRLRYFLAVIDEGTFTAAAAAERVSQSGISTQISKLERELGVTLLDRSARRVALTPAGRRLVPAVRTAIAATDAVTGLANDIRGLVTGSLRVGTVTGLMWPPLFDALAAMHSRHPGIDLRLHEATSDTLLAEVRGGTTDVAVAAWVNTPDGVSAKAVLDDQLVAVVGTRHPWRDRAGVTAGDLSDAPLISFPSGTGARAALDALLTRSGHGPTTPRWEVTSPAAVHALTTRGLGVGVVSATVASEWDDVAAIPVDEPSARSQLGVLWPPRPSHAAQALLEELLPHRSATVHMVDGDSDSSSTRRK